MKVRLDFSGSMDDLAQAYLMLVQALLENKTLSQDDLLDLVNKSPGMKLSAP